MATQRPDARSQQFDPLSAEETIQSFENEDHGDVGNGTGDRRRPMRKKTKTRNSLGFELETERVIEEDAELSPDERVKVVKPMTGFEEILSEGNESDGDVKVALPISSAGASKKKGMDKEIPKDLTERLK